MSELLATHLIRDVPDFPKPGILFKDITPVLADPVALGEVLARLMEYGASRGAEAIAGVESRGFILGAPLASAMHLPFVPIRKPGKLPYETIREDYALEYGVNSVEVHVDAVVPGAKVLVVDDLLATGGTAAASIRLIERLGADVCGVAFLVELGFLNGRAAIPGHDVLALIRFD